MQLVLSGAPAHTRTLTTALFSEGSGANRARGVVLDLRKRGLIPMAESWQTAGIIHEMSVEAQLDATLGITEISAEQPHIAVEASPGTAGECCRDPVDRIEALAGTRLDAAYVKRLSAALGGPLGCSHVLTLAQFLGAAANTALTEEAAAFAGSERPRGQRWFERNLSVDGLETPDGGLDLAAQLADVHLAPEVDEDTLGLARHREIRLTARVSLETMQFGRIEAAQRDTTPERTGDWQPCDVAFLVGHPALGGMAKTVMTKSAPGPLQDVLLNLAPALIQCMPALGSAFDRMRGAEAQATSSARKQALGVSGMTDSCYMWRRGGGMQRQLEGPAEPGSGSEA